MHHMSKTGAVSTGTFNAGPDTFVAAEDLCTLLPPGHEGNGWLAQRGYVPLGYKGDASKTAKTFPVIDVFATRCPATGPVTAPTAASNCWAAIR